MLIALPMTWVGCQATRAGYESPKYSVVENDSSEFEIRRYPAMEVVATKSGDNSGGDGSFMRLFRYIDKGNEAEQKIAMTTPVLMSEGKMHFVVPTAVAADGTPAPANDAVVVETIPAGIFATMRFAKREEAQASARTLMESLKKAGKNTEGKPIFAYYDPPWTPAMLRRNEVLIRLAE